MDDLASRFYSTAPPAPQTPPAAPVAATPAPVTASSHEDLALRLYGPDQPPAAEQPDQTPSSDEAPASSVPVNIQELRDADGARRIYGAQQTYKESIPDSLYADTDALAPEVQKVVVTELREIAADIGATPSDINTFRRVANSITAEPSLEQRAAWHDEAIQLLNEQYGQGAAQAARDAAKFAQRDPRLVQMLNNKGLGDHPQIILQFARLAREAKAAGKFR